MAVTTASRTPVCPTMSPLGEIAAEEVELMRGHGTHHVVCDLHRLHSGCLLKGNYIRGDFLVGFQVFVHLAGPVAVPEIGHVAVFLGFGQGVLPDAMSAEDLP